MRTDEVDALVRAAQGHGRRVIIAKLDGPADKADIIDTLARAFDMPRWFGRNWDALYDCLTDLSWLPADGYVLILTGASPDAANAPILTDLLTDCCDHWQAEGVPFHVLTDGVVGANTA
ncbi:MAG: barnase inhibitor [Proteobacteria bacterium]|nr:MAG: barnase inhibitor [Pseudomonadota bacterium]